MSNILIALETSGPCCGVALARATGGSAAGDGVCPMGKNITSILLEPANIRVREHLGTANHAEQLLPMVDALLAEEGLARRAIAALAFGQGPGGFTGLRVAAGITQGLALALDVPVLPVGSLRAMACQVELSGHEVAVVALDARMSEIYLAAYVRSAGDTGAASVHDRQALCAPVLIAARDALAWAQAQLPRWSQAAGRALAAVAVGDAWALAEAPSLPADWRRASNGLRPDARSVAQLAWRDWHAGQGQGADAAVPVYVRDKVAYTSAERAAGLGGNPRAALAEFPGLSELAPVAAVSLAPMTAADLAEVAALEASVQSHPWTHGQFADALAAGYAAWVLRAGSQLLGFAVLMLAPDVAHLLTIAVAREVQQRGYGRQLLAQCTAQAHASGVGLLLEVRVSNQAARAFYQRAGFTQIGVRRAYYPAGEGGESGREDALVLQKPVSAAEPGL